MRSKCCVIIGAYVNGYSIIQELYENDVKDLILIDYSKDPGFYSNKVSERYIIENSSTELKHTLERIHYIYKKIILYPTQDVHLNQLSEIYDYIKGFCFVAFNPEGIIEYQKKSKQYEFCKKYEIPFPQSFVVERKEDFDKIDMLKFPIIVKPILKDNLSNKIFRNIILNDIDEYNNTKTQIIKLIANNNKFLISEIIPGAGDNIYAYVAYRDSKGNILGEWTGKKLSQFPDDFGVFASAKAIRNKVVLEQGRKLIEVMDLWGISEPEFKYDSRDGKYKLMEINLRPMMWHRVGALNGMPLNYIQFLDANSKFPLKENYICEFNDTHYVNIAYELLNLLIRKDYFKVFRKNVLSAAKLTLAMFDKKDIKPFLFTFLLIFRKYLHKKKRDKL